MNRYRNVAFGAALLAAALLLALQTGQACPVCYGDPQSNMTAGLNMAVLSLLGITGSVLAAVAAFFVFLRRRMRALNQRFADKLN